MITEEEFKKYVDSTLKSIIDKINDDEVEFLDFLVKTFNKISKERDDLKEKLKRYESSL